MRQAVDVSVDGDCVFAKGVGQDDVGRLPAHPSQRLEGLAVVGDLSPVEGHQIVGAANDVLRLASKEAAGLDEGLDLLGCGLCQFARRRVAAEEGRSHQVDTLVRTLSRENDGDQQLEMVAVVEFRCGLGIEFIQAVEDLDRACDQGLCHSNRGLAAGTLDHGRHYSQGGLHRPLRHQAAGRHVPSVPS